MYALLIVLALLFSTPAYATTYYVSPTGTGTNCTDAQDPDNAHNTIAEGVACLTNGSADILYLRAGTYTTGINLHSPAKAGAGSNYLTIAAFPGETVTIAPTASPLVVSSVSHHFIIDGIIFDGVNTTTQGSTGGLHLQNAANYILRNLEIKRSKYHGIYIEGPTNALVQNVTIHDQVSPCTSGFRWYGIYVFTGTNVVIERSTLYNNPGGGFHINNGPITGIIIRKNKIYNNNSCGTTVSRVGGVTVFEVSTNQITGVQVYDNVVYGTGTTNETDAPGIQMSRGVSGAKVFNNTVYDNQGYGVVNMAVADAGNLFANNITLLSTLGNLVDGSGDGTLTTNRSTGTMSDFVTSPSTGDFTLKAGSAAIGAGTAQTGFTYAGTVDQGAFDAWSCTSASIDTNVMDITCNTVNVPILPAAGITGFTVGCTGSGCGTPTVSTAERRSGSDTVIRLTISGITGNACAVGQTWTWSYTPGNVTDSALIGNTDNQPLLAASSQAVTSVCTGSPTTPPATGLHVDLPLNENTGTTAVDLEGNANLTLTGSTLPSWTTGKTGSGLSFPDGTVESYGAIAYGSGLNPSSSSLSVCLGVLPHSTSPAQKIVFSADNGTNQRFYVGWIGGTWQLGIQSSSFSAARPSEFPLVAEWTRLCIVADKDAVGGPTATLYVNGVKGTTSISSVKTYTSYTLSSNFKVGVGTFDVNYGGSTADDIKIYAATALTDQEVADDYTAWNPESPAATGTFVQRTFKFQGLRVNSSGDPIDLRAADSNISVVPGGAFELIIQTDCTTANCDPISQRLRYSRNGGTYTAIPDALGADNIAFYQVTADPDVVSAAVTCCLSGELTQNNGITIFTSSAIPTIDLTQDSSVVLRYVFKIGASATAGDTYDFRVYNQDGNALDTYTATPRVTVVDMSMGVGF